MVELMKRERDREAKGVEVFDRLDRLFDDWARMLPFRRTVMLNRPPFGEEMIRVDERREKGALVIRAELPGIDPDRDVEVTVGDGVVHIEAERREESEETGKGGYIHRELRYGSFSRTLPLPEGVGAEGVTATYKDGILEIRVPAPEPVAEHKVAIAKG